MRWYHWLVYFEGIAAMCALVVWYWLGHWHRWVRKLSFQDGDTLPGGKVVSLAGGFCVAAYRCGCGREQMAQCEGFSGGLSENAARQVGWNYADGGWMCPFCSDETDKLFSVFERAAK